MVMARRGTQTREGEGGARGGGSGTEGQRAAELLGSGRLRDQWVHVLGLGAQALGTILTWLSMA